MKTNAVSHRILPSAILILFLLSNLSLTARNKPLAYSAAEIILPALITEKILLHADLVSRKGMINPMKHKILNHSSYQTTLKTELMMRMNVMNPGNGNPSNEYELLIKSPVLIRPYILIQIR